VCHCGKEAVIRTSRRPNSYGDTFYGCALSKSGCNFFSWCYMHARTQHAARRATEAAFCEREREREEPGRNGGERCQNGRSGPFRPRTSSMRALMNARNQHTKPSRASAACVTNRACVERHRNPQPVCVVQQLYCQSFIPAAFSFLFGVIYDAIGLCSEVLGQV
jgi:hypothetical protein